MGEDEVGASEQSSSISQMETLIRHRIIDQLRKQLREIGFQVFQRIDMDERLKTFENEF